MKVLVDTNFLLHCVRHKIQLFEHLHDEFSEILFPRGAVDELVRVAQEGSPRDREAAEVGLKLLVVSQVKILPLEGYVDQQILDYAFTHKGVVVATLDKALRRILQKKVKVLGIIGRKKLEIL